MMKLCHELTLYHSIRLNCSKFLLGKGYKKMFLPEKLLIKTICPVFSKNSIHHCTQIAHNLCGSNLMVKKHMEKMYRWLF